MDPLVAAAAFLFAVKIKDGLFLGNAASAYDEDFLSSNKISHIINCAALEVGNGYPIAGLQYLPFPWRDNDTSVIIDPQGRNVNDIVEFIDKAYENGEGVLVQSLLGRSRCCVVIIAYFIKRYGWSLEDAVEFVRVKNVEMELKPGHLSQLQAYVKKLFNGRPAPMSNILDPDLDPQDLATLDETQLILRNTYFNSLTRPEDLEATISELQFGKTSSSRRASSAVNRRSIASRRETKIQFATPIVEILGSKKSVPQHRLLVPSSASTTSLLKSSSGKGSTVSFAVDNSSIAGKPKQGAESSLSSTEKSSSIGSKSRSAPSIDAESPSVSGGSEDSSVFDTTGSQPTASLSRSSQPSSRSSSMSSSAPHRTRSNQSDGTERINNLRYGASGTVPSSRSTSSRTSTGVTSPSLSSVSHEQQPTSNRLFEPSRNRPGNIPIASNSAPSRNRPQSAPVSSASLPNALSSQTSPNDSASVASASSSSGVLTSGLPPRSGLTNGSGPSASAPASLRRHSSYSSRDRTVTEDFLRQPSYEDLTLPSASSFSSSRLNTSTSSASNPNSLPHPHAVSTASSGTGFQHQITGAGLSSSIGAMNYSASSSATSNPNSGWQLPPRTSGVNDINSNPNVARRSAAIQRRSTPLRRSPSSSSSTASSPSASSANSSISTNSRTVLSSPSPTLSSVVSSVPFERTSSGLPSAPTAVWNSSSPSPSGNASSGSGGSFPSSSGPGPSSRVQVAPISVSGLRQSSDPLLYPSHRLSPSPVGGGSNTSFSARGSSSANASHQISGAGSLNSSASVGLSVGSRFSESPYAAPPLRLPTPPRTGSSGANSVSTLNAATPLDDVNRGKGKKKKRRNSAGGGSSSSGSSVASSSSSASSSRLFKPTASSLARYR